MDGGDDKPAGGDGKRHKTVGVNIKDKCIVPTCMNHIKRNPEKVFFSVPGVKNVDARRRWLEACQRDDYRPLPPSDSTQLRCCEDHFKLEEDAENFLQVKMMGVRPRLKPHIIPHVFDCQPGFSGADSSTSGSTSQQTCVADKEMPSCSATDKAPSLPHVKPSYRSKTSQVNLCKAQTSDASLSPIKFPTKKRKLDADHTSDSSSDDEQTGTETISSTDESGWSGFTGDDDEMDDSESGESNIEDLQMRSTSLERVRSLHNKHSRLYLGVPENSLFILDTLAARISFKGRWLLPRDIVALVLRKIRLGEPFAILGIEFGISESQAGRVFKTYVALISDYMKELIVWPDKESIHRLLPIPFRARYSNVQSLIDGFEIQIEKPSNPVLQALTWSDYKKANTLKYLVSTTPNGVVNFVSQGYGGRIADTHLFEICGYLDCLTPGSVVMADRGFKHVGGLLHAKGCSLVRPPSVVPGEKMSKAEARLCRQVASLRVHIERVVRRFREFNMLMPYSCIDCHLVPCTDFAVNIAGGLINMQGPLVK